MSLSITMTFISTVAALGACNCGGGGGSGGGGGGGGGGGSCGIKALPSGCVQLLPSLWV